MKNYLLTACLFSMLFSCKKDDSPSIINKPTGKDTLLILATKWKIIEDSVMSNNYTFPWGSYPIPGAYYGTSDDYYLFDFTNNVLAHENGHDLNGKYKLLPNSQILIDSTEHQYVGDIKTLNNVKATFEWALISSNGGTYFRRLTLTK